MLPLWIVVATVLPISGLQTFFNNLAPRLDTDGRILDGHDHQIRRIPGGPFVMYALEYGDYPEPKRYGCDGIATHGTGFRLDHNISVWTSPSLASGSWTFERHAIEMSARPAGIVFRPDAIYNPNTGQYVLWMNVATPGVPGATYAACLASSPLGPFELVQSVVQIAPANRTRRVGDFHLFTDPSDGVGYAIYAADSQIWIAQLSDDYIGTTGRYFGPFPQPAGAPDQKAAMEAPSMFERYGTYYALMGWCCCFCKQGSTSFVFKASSPLGPWHIQPDPDLACRDTGSRGPASETIVSPGNGCNVVTPTATSVVRSQHSAVVVIDKDGMRTDASQSRQVLWVGDMWQQAPDGIKGHDPQYVYPLQFESNGNIQTMRWLDNFTIEV